MSDRVVPKPVPTEGQATAADTRQFGDRPLCCFSLVVAAAALAPEVIAVVLLAMAALGVVVVA